MDSKIFDSLNKISLQDILNTMGDAVCVADNNMTIHTANQAFANLYGSTVKDVLGKTAFEVYPDFKKSLFYEVVQNSIKTGKASTRVGYSANTKKWLVGRSFKYDENNFILSIHDLIKEEEKTGYMNKVDSLTSLGNRFAFEEDVKNVIRVEQNFGILLIDINRFHIINETLGFHVGDMFLMEVGSKLRHNVATGNGLYRVGPDQFLILSLQSKILFEKQIIEILKIFSSPLKYAEKEYILNSTASYIYQNNFAEEIEFITLLKYAEIALLEAKRKKVDLLEFSSVMDVHRDKLELEKDLRAALAENQFELFYQPQCDLLTNKVCGAEALIRWQHPEKGFMSPAEFLPLAQELNLMKEIDKWVFIKSMTDFNLFVTHDIGIPLSVNLSADSLSSSEMIEFFEEKLKPQGVQHDMVTFEITETSLMSDVEKSKEVIAFIAKKGSKIAIDDFGTGYSSMEYLIKYPSDYLKIDREFIKEISTSKNHKIMVANIIRMGHSLGMSIVAEGVETLEEMNLLKQMDCDIVQGYYYARPMNFKNFKDFVALKGISSLKSKIV